MREGPCGGIFPALSFSWLFVYMVQMNIIYMNEQDGYGFIFAISNLTSCLYVLISIDSYYRLWEKNLKSRLSIFEGVS